MGKSTISMAILSSYVKLPEGNTMVFPCFLVLSVLSLPGRDPHENVLALDHIPAEIWWKAMDFETRFSPPMAFFFFFSLFHCEYSKNLGRYGTHLKLHGTSKNGEKKSHVWAP